MTFSLFLVHSQYSSSPAFDLAITVTFPPDETVVSVLVEPTFSHFQEITESEDGTSAVLLSFDELERGSYVVLNIEITVNESVAEGTKVNASGNVRYDSSPGHSNDTFPGRVETLGEEFKPSRVSVLGVNTELYQSYSPSEIRQVGLAAADNISVSFGESLLLRSTIMVLQPSYDGLSLFMSLSSSDVPVTAKLILNVDGATFTFNDTRYWSGVSSHCL